MYLKNDGSVGECVFPSYTNCLWPTYNFPELPPDLKFNSENSTLVGRLMEPTVTGEIEVTVDVICKIGCSFTFHFHINTDSYGTQKKLDETQKKLDESREENRHMQKKLYEALEENKHAQKKLDETLEQMQKKLDEMLEFSKKQSPDADKNTWSWFTGRKLMSIDNDDLPYCFAPIALTWSDQSPTFLRDWLIWNLVVVLLATLREKYRSKND